MNVVGGKRAGPLLQPAATEVSERPAFNTLNVWPCTFITERLLSSYSRAVILLLLTSLI